MIIDSKQDFGADSIQRNLVITDGTVSVGNNALVFTNATVRLTNTEIHSESFDLKESICSQENLVFGSCESSELNFQFSGNVIDLTNKVLNVYMYSKGDVRTLFKIGTYKVKEDNATADRRARKIVAYDKLNEILNADVTNWYNSLFADESTTKTIREIRTSFLNYFGIADATEIAQMPNDGIVIKKTINPTTLAGSTVIKALCEVNGTFGHITRDNRFKCIRISQGKSGIFPSAELFPSKDLFPVKPKSANIPTSCYIPPLDIKKYQVESITKLQIRSEEDDIGSIVGTGDNCYIVTGNFLLYGMDANQLQTVATNMLSAITKLEYRPFSVKAKGNPLIEVGDFVRITGNDESIEGVLMTRTLSGIQNLFDNYTSQGDIQQSRKINGVNERIEQLAGKTAKIKTDVDGVSAELAHKVDNTTYNAYVEATAQQISSKVSQTTYDTDKESMQGDINSKVSTTTYEAYVQQTAKEISSKVSETTYNQGMNGKVDVSTYNSYVQQTAQQINAKVESISDINGLLNASSMQISANGMEFKSTGSIVINTSNLIVNADGTAEFKGTVNVSGSDGNTTIANGYLLQASGNNYVLLSNGLILASKNGVVRDLSDAITARDLSSASVNYANSAGSADSANYAQTAGSTNMLGSSVNSAIYDTSTNSLNPAISGNGHLGQISTHWQSVAVSGSVYIGGERLTASDIQKLHAL